MSPTVVLHSEFSSMTEIIESPYEGNESAEVGEHLFDYTKSLMDLEGGLGSGFRKLEEGPSKEAIEIFGEEQAKIILETNHHISASGMLYGCGWTEGNIRGRQFGVLKKDLLLMCILDHRIARNNAQCIKVVIKDLDLWKIFVDVLSQWNLKATHPRLARCKSINSFKRKATQCLKSILFIARAATCMKVLEWDFIAIPDDTSLKTKILACFAILETQVQVTDGKPIIKKPAARMKTSSKKVPAMAVGGRANSRVPISSTKKVPPVADVGILVTTTEQYRDNNNNPMNVSVDSADSHIHRSGDISNTTTTRRTRLNIHQQRASNPNSPIINNNRNCSELTRRLSINVPGPSPTKTNDPQKYDSDLTRRLISKDTEIKGISIYGDAGKKKEPAVTNTTHLTRASSGIRTSTSDEISPNDVELVHNLYSSNSKNGSSHTKSELSSNVPAKKTKFSHALFDVKNNANQNNEDFVKMPKNLALTASNAGPGFVSDNCSSNSAADPNFWYPIDPEEMILTSIEIEAAWLVEESMYCDRQATVDWVFVMKYASPMLKVELRQLHEVGGVKESGAGNNDDETFAKLLHNGLAAKRFVIVRRDIRRKLLKNVVRPRMQRIVPRLRKATHPLRLKKMAAVAAR